MLLRIVAGIVLFASLLPAQEVPPDVESAESQTGSVRRGKEGGRKGENGVPEKGEIEEKNLTPEQRLARNIINGASTYCSLRMSVNPPRLMPGQTGTVRVVASLQGKAVLPSPAPLQVVSPAQQGMVSLGAHSMLPAEPGRLATAYLGRPVYDNYAVLELPVTMSPTATVGSKHVVALDLSFDLFDGTSAEPISRFLDRVSTEVQVGFSPDPAVRGGSKPTPAPSAAAGTSEVPAAMPTTREKPAAAGDEIRANVGSTAPQPEPKPTASTSGEPAGGDTLYVEDTSGSLPTMLLVGGGVLALAVVLLLARKK